MKSSFKGIPKEGLAFLADLELNNNREWFDAHKPVYQEKLRAPLEQFCAAVGAQLAPFAPEYMTEPKRAIFRIYRDTRFSNNKTPYKTAQGALFFRSDLGKNEAAGFYFEVSPKHLGIAGGLYMPNPDYLRAVRTHIIENHTQWEKLVTGRALEKAVGRIQGEKLSRPPKGYPAAHPALDWIKHKQWYFWVELDPALATSATGVKEVTSRFRIMAPVVEFLNQPLLGLKRKKSPMLFDL
jgi:uncharacterized protein (TIGR02453 family)